MADKDWVSEQEELLMMDANNNSTDAARLLEHSPTNRDISQEQARIHTVSRFFGKATGITFYENLPLECEKAQMSIDDMARHDFMKVAIEQWQGKIQAKKEGVKALL